ncbi:MAG TPA: cobalt transporter CbiM [Spirochaetota bacterium]|nr:cobalt transporter CbiM [Spirochaetota bacterium]HPJ34412.1 cobalt transporter CbiM [Spirochaetota bacterium]
MHIGDGVLQGPVCIASAAAAVAIASVSLKKTDAAEIPKVAVMTAAFFVASLIHVKVGPTSSHLVLNGLLGAVLGFAAFPSIFAALIFQAIMFQHGGITTLGVNALTMGVPALLSAFIFRYRSSMGTALIGARSFVAGFTAVMLSAAGVAIYLISAGEEFYKTAQLIMYLNLPVALIEGIATVFIVAFLMKVKPDILGLK